jgi:hypothetical protein
MFHQSSELRTTVLETIRDVRAPTQDDGVYSAQILAAFERNSMVVPTLMESIFNSFSTDIVSFLVKFVLYMLICKTSISFRRLYELKKLVYLFRLKLCWSSRFFMLWCSLL